LRFSGKKGENMKNGFGDLLKQAREAKGYKYSEIHKILKMDESYLKALEEENFDFFEKIIYMKLFLRTYAKFLKIEEAKIMELFNEALKSRGILDIEKENAKNQTKKEILPDTEAKELKQPLPFLFNLNNKNKYLIIGGIGILVILIIWLLISFLGAKNKENKTKIEEGKNIYVVQPVQTLKIIAKAKEDVWMKARYNEKEEDFLLKNGEEKKWSDVTKIVFLIGNAGGVEFIVNGDNIGTIGEKGEVINGLVFEVGKNWYIDRNQGFKREMSPLLKNQITPTETVEINNTEENKE
jgi:transcriptional regulator with XRE-family HTH domain